MSDANESIETGNQSVAVADSGEIPLGMYINMLIELEEQYGSTIPVLTRGMSKQCLLAGCPVTIRAVRKESEYEYDVNGKLYVLTD
ncbi:Hypothetical protein PACV_140 [Pacmanvirus A23]|uniref:Hypothetical protein n=1 Tax=Pacmanvirus A23 TaxID=1932881 RepID=UPI000A093541|nr:Hypothetical protein B9W72_gp138 [Pacmanvirus A23]SIP85855.1 Hypothetical protein PACV_140 [Pacmanvirus A23]